MNVFIMDIPGIPGECLSALAWSPFPSIPGNEHAELYRRPIVPWGTVGREPTRLTGGATCLIR